MAVKHVSGSSDFARQLRDAGGKLVVVDYSASWCGPCKMISPVFDDLARKHTDVVFLKVSLAPSLSLCTGDPAALPQPHHSSLS